MTSLHVGQRVRIREQYRRAGDFDEAVITEIDPDDHTIDVDVWERHPRTGEEGWQPWGQWFSRLPDGTYVIEPIPDSKENSP
jgi:hypothetical protein